MFPSTALWEAISQPFKRAQGGLFHGKMKQYGNNVPFSKHKTRRTWLPNIQQKRIRSEILGENIKLKLTTRALKTIKTKGGLDKYLNTTSSNLLGETGMRLRLRVREKVLENKGRSSPEFKIVPRYPEISVKNIKDMFRDAKATREYVAKSLGKERLANAEETIAHINKLRRARRHALRVV